MARSRWSPGRGSARAGPGCAVPRCRSCSPRSAAGVAFAVARYGLGHPAPFFAPVAAWVALGFSADRNLRRVAELAIGVAVGVLAGDLLVHLIGNGPVQVAVVLAIAVLVARFLDRGDLLAIQAGVQAVVVVVLPPTAAGPVGRWVDALVGGLIALVVAALSPQDPRRRVRAVAEEAMTELADLLQVLARGCARRTRHWCSRRCSGAGPRNRCWTPGGLPRSPAVRLPGCPRPSAATATSSAALAAAATHADRAMRNARVLARRSTTVADRTDPGGRRHVVGPRRRPRPGSARGAGDRHRAVDGQAPTRARETLGRVGQGADPTRLAPGRPACPRTGPAAALARGGPRRDGRAGGGAGPRPAPGGVSAAEVSPAGSPGRSTKVVRRQADGPSGAQRLVEPRDRVAAGRTLAAVALRRCRGDGRLRGARRSRSGCRRARRRRW